MRKLRNVWKRVISISFIPCLLLFLFIFGSGAAKNNAPIKIRIASAGPATEFVGDGQTAAGTSTRYFITEIEKRSNGRITAQVFPGGQLASATEEYMGGLQDGAFEMIVLNNGAWSDYTNAFAGLNIPYLYFDFETAYAVLDSEVGIGWRKRAQEETGVIPLAYFDIGFRELTNSTREIKVPADLKGIKLRTMVDDIQMESWRLLGAAVTPVPYAELYSALQQKLVDGQENPVSNITASKIYELQPYMTMTNHNFTASLFAISPVLWGKLSPEDQKLVADVAVEAQNKGREKTQIFAGEFMKIIADAGVKIYYPTTEELKQFQDTVKPVWTKVEKNMGSEEFKKLIDFVSDYTAKKEKK
ncbi:MAG: TRAP transporter substrate-binding protein [Fusobacteriaceae bacterium]|jgi:tripartite ATP-independent transporter DctP family solute receptor|nr:TRAP transporter substrate-binding protein [Fusobacteriaceae bacterium]